MSLPKAHPEKYTAPIFMWGNSPVAVLGGFVKWRQSYFYVALLGAHDYEDICVVPMRKLVTGTGRFAQQDRNSTWREVSV